MANPHHSLLFGQEKKPSIYDSPEPSYVVVREEDHLESSIREARHEVTNYFNDYSKEVNKATGKLFDFEDRVISATKDITTETEPLLPNTIYVVLSGFTGSILSRHRNVFVRATVPTLFTSVATVMLYPTTLRNTLVSSYKAVTGASTYPQELDMIPKQVSTIKSFLPDLSKFFS